MSVLIKGIDFPIDGSRKTIIIYSDGCCTEPNGQWDETLMQGVQAVPVPQHGDLIDRDDLTERLDGIWDCNDMVFEDDDICGRIHADCKSCRWSETRDYIKDKVIKYAPAIIPSEVDE